MCPDPFDDDRDSHEHLGGLGAPPPTSTASATTASIGAKKGYARPSTLWIRNQAMPAATAAWATGHAVSRTRPKDDLKVERSIGVVSAARARLLRRVRRAGTALAVSSTAGARRR